jgi:2-keto-4-pentenoate hydratase
MIDSCTQGVADRLRKAELNRVPIAPIFKDLPELTIEAAYKVQAALNRQRVKAGDRIIGRKIGLTSLVVQKQLGVAEPDFGTLFSCMEVLQGQSVRTDELIQPRIEAEIALTLGRDLTDPDLTAAELARGVEFVVPALEVVDSRIMDWKITIHDTIADNGSSARFVVGHNARRLTDLDLELCGMSLERNGSVVSSGVGAACLGNPLASALWLARARATAGDPLRAGDLVLTGALGPMVDARQGEFYTAKISGLGSVSVRFD